jgi:hypothetical protein
MYLDNFKEKHDDYEDLGEGRTFKSPLPIDQIQLGRGYLPGTIGPPLLK